MLEWGRDTGLSREINLAQGGIKISSSCPVLPDFLTFYQIVCPGL